MFEYTIEQISNGWLLTIRTPSSLVATKKFYIDEAQAWQAVRDIAQGHITELAS